MGGRLTRGAKVPYWTKDPIAKDVLVEVDETVQEPLPKETFRNELAAKKTVFAYLFGKMQMHYIRILARDEFRAESSPYDLRRGRIAHGSVSLRNLSCLPGFEQWI